ncbi:hypothetical protein SAMN02745165_01874 [Malonomonas rubra DSM 5091]|uniref:Uncharacterized protein n=1 Tax=Malonomonas rubra DSM 5091 TaxID=1122189 RepID=A0A1M6HL63_MALRU|nr:hypothetical protein [Malonomonas rubra]SHJ22897.1 hypothetical protein SAMN02745165_01874 [Malonomonas rubra DSM 5091]
MKGAWLTFYLRMLFGLFLFAAVLSLGACIHRPVQKEKPYLLIAKIASAKGVVKTLKGERETVFRGQVAFKVTTADKGQLKLALYRLNLWSPGVVTSRGESGVIGMTLVGEEGTTSYSGKSGRLKAESTLTLHYPLIDKIKGYRSKPGGGDTNFIPFTETVKGKLVGEFKQGLKPAKGEGVGFNGELVFELDDGDPALLPWMRCVISLEFIWERLFESAEILKIQPVFIGSGEDDPTATGESFDTLVRRAFDLWNRCGTERCIRLLVDPPTYVDNDAYRVLDNDAEAVALKDEVNVADAIEIFVVERFVDSMAVNWGGGGTFSSGTAASKIVSSDQNLDVPCPEPCTSHETTAGSNAAMCTRCGDTLGCGDVNYQHLSHELGHVLNLGHPLNPNGLADSTDNSVMEPSGLCCDNPDVQSGLNCRNASNPLLYWGWATCEESPDITD